MTRNRDPLRWSPSEGRPGDVRDGRPEPRRTPPGEHWAWRAARGAAAAVATGAGLVVAGSGIWLWSRYRPLPADPGQPLGSELEQVRALRDAYGTAWSVLAVSAVVWMVLALVSSPGARRILATGGVVALLGGALVAWTAPQLAWHEVTRDLGEVRETSAAGVVGLLQGDATVYLVGPAGGIDEVSPDTMEGLAAAHVVGASLVAVGLLSGGLLARARRRRPDPTPLVAGRA